MVTDQHPTAPIRTRVRIGAEANDLSVGRPRWLAASWSHLDLQARGELPDVPCYRRRRPRAARVLRTLPLRPGFTAGAIPVGDHSGGVSRPSIS